MAASGERGTTCTSPDRSILLTSSDVSGFLSWISSPSAFMKPAWVAHQSGR